MSNSNGSTPAGGQNPQFDQNGYPQNGHPQQGYPQNGHQQNGYPVNGQQHGYAQQGQPAAQHPQPGYPQGQPNPGYRQQWQQPEPPKKQNFFLRHKILTGLLALAVLIGFGSALSGGGKKDDAAKSATSNTSMPTSGDTTPSDTKTAQSKGAETKTSESKSADTKDALPAVGQPIKDGDFTFTVTQVERDVPSIGGSFMNKKAQGAYTLVHVTVKNTGTQTQSMSASDQKAYDANGIGYEATSDGAIYIEGNDTLYTEINPGNTLKGILVFDAPKGTKLTKVRLHDSMFSNGIEGSL